MRIPVIIVMFLWLTACASDGVTSQVVRYHDGPPPSPGSSFAVVGEGEQAQSLEFRHYAQRIANRLQAQGLHQAASLSQADYKVFFSYGVEAGSQRVITHSDPYFYGGTGYGRYGRGVGLGVGVPLYRSGPTMAESYTIYTHRLQLRLLRTAAQTAPVFEGRATLHSSAENITTTLPCLIAAMFRDFPGVNGVPQRYLIQPAECI